MLATSSYTGVAWLTHYWRGKDHDYDDDDDDDEVMMMMMMRRRRRMR